jgi:hypothetical protein
MSTTLPDLLALHRRRFLGISGGAFGLVPLASLWQREAVAATERPPVRRVVFLFMNGGPSQIDTFDPKPALARLDGTSFAGGRIGSGTRAVGALWQSAFRFAPRGDCGLEVSELYPEVGRFADDLCVIRSLRTDSPIHAGALLQMHTGQTTLGGATLGAWVDYGLGDARLDLPTFVVMPDPRGVPINAQANWSVGPLPAAQPARIDSTTTPFPGLHRRRPLATDREQRLREAVTQLDALHLGQSRTHPDLERRIRAAEQAWRMQAAAPEAVALDREPRHTQALYGLDRPETAAFGARCLLARRLLERGVRFVQIYSGGGKQEDTWDAHVGNNARHRRFAAETDRPIAALLEDLKRTGLWDDTLVVWGGEFGRTPTMEARSQGRDHNAEGFTMWLAGGAVRGGHVVGATDEIGFRAVEKVCTVADLHATILHLLGIDHTTLRWSHDGLETSLTGTVPCRVIDDVLA